MANGEKYKYPWETEGQGEGVSPGGGQPWWAYPLRGLEYALYPFSWAGMGARAFAESPGARTGLVQGAFPQMMERPEQVPEETWARWQTKPWEPQRGILPGGEAYEEYRQLPLAQQIGYEAIPWAISALIPGAAVARAALRPAAQAGRVAPRVARAALKPAEVAERGIQKITEPILQKLARLMGAHKTARAATARARRVEWGKRFRAAEETLKTIEEPEHAFRAARAKLRGETPLETGALRELLKPDEFAQLRIKIKDHPTLRFAEKNRADIALNKLLSTDEVLQPAELKLLERIFPGITEFNILKFKMGNRAWRGFVDIANLPRALLASTDLSATLRQGGILLARRPYLFGGTMKWQFRTLFSQKNWQVLDDIIRSDPDFGLFELYRGYLAPEPGAIGKLMAREETFMSRIAEKIPIVKVSERAFTAGLNYLRFNSFKHGLNLFRKTGATSELDIEGLVKMVTWASGRGSLPRTIQGSAPMVNAMMFSPRLVLSRFQLPTLLFHASPAVRKEAARTLVQFLGFGASVLTLAKLAGADVEADPRSSDFGKIKIGNTRLDIWTGYIQYARFLGQLVAAERKIPGTGKKAEANRMESIWLLMQSKASPLASIIIDLLKGTTYLGEPMLEGGWETFVREMRNRLTPLFAQDMWDAIETDGLLGGLVAMPGALGVGVVSYKGGGQWTPSLPSQTPTPKEGGKVKLPWD